MKIKKIVAAIAAAAVAVSMTAVNAFAAVTFGDYPGDWSATTVIPKSEFAAIGGDVKVVLDVEQKAPLVGDINSLLKPMNICVSWDAVTANLTSDTAYAKGDGFIVVPKDCTTIEFVVPETVWSAFVDYEGGESDQAGLAFQVCHVNIKSAELSAGAAQGAMKLVSEEESSSLMKTGALPAAEEAPAEEATEEEATEEAPAEEATEEAPAEEAAEEVAEVVEEAPAADTTTAPAATGNAPVAAIAVVMALAGAAAVASKKN